MTYEEYHLIYVALLRRQGRTKLPIEWECLRLLMEALTTYWHEHKIPSSN